jgi:hypothetical protein
MPLALKAERANAMLGIHLSSVLEGGGEDVVMEDAPSVEEAGGGEEEDGAGVEPAAAEGRPKADKGEPF